jgi:2-polyprenyl-6-methoxyphenol hydroxylase-like FAD-dependent oxidoreductase
MTRVDAHPDFFQGNGHAVVVGASIAGLLAARVLAPHFRRVTVIERDTLPNSADPRGGVPQGRHAHALLIRGERILSELFPELVPDLIARGAIPVTLGRDLRWYHFGCWKKRFDSELTGIAMSRPALELEILRRVRALPNVTVFDGTVVTRYVADWENARLTGVCVRGRNSEMPEDQVHADLVVDASGRGSQTPQRLAELGYRKPEESLVKADFAYATRIYERPTRGWDWKSLYVVDRPPAKRGGIVVSVEANRWMVTLIGCHGDHPPADEAGFLEFARSLPAPDLHAAIVAARPLSDIVPHGFPESQRRHYESLARFPIGLVVLGDALCSFNPVYGQGMTVSAIEAKLLQDCLQDLQARSTPSLDALTSNFRSRVAKAADLPWQLATGEDLRFAQTSGPRSARLRFMHWYTAKIHEAAGLSEVVAERFLHVSNMVAPRSTLFGPDVLKELLRVAWQRAPTDDTAGPAPTRRALR